MNFCDLKQSYNKQEIVQEKILLMSTLLRKKAIMILLGLCILLPTLLGGFVFWQVKWGDTKFLEKTAIFSKTREETRIYYLDEKTQIGSLFDRSHRRYTPIKELPEHLLHAIIASEDKNFYTHIGVDFLALFKAFLSGLIKGRFTHGASTITQQTVKNIVNDWEPSFTRKFREMIRALQLETLYSKHQILEFYINQFYVVSNGNGIGIAAEYYFNKKPSELTLIESAFIAGSLKGPGKYNPFIKYTKEAKQKAKNFAMERKNYVLKRMYQKNWISEEVYTKTRQEEIPYNKGSFANAEIALVTLIKKQLEKKEIINAIGINSKEDLNIAGYKIYSTIDEKLQSYSQLAMRRNLSRVETILSDFSPEEEKKFKKLKNLQEKSFVYGKIEKIEKSSNDYPKIHLSFGYPKGILSTRSLRQQASLLSLSERTHYKKNLKKISETLKVGDVLFCEVTKYDKKKNLAQVELRKRPEISGGLIALDKGEVRSIIAGFDTLGYNRALFAKRQPGSLFKTLIFFAGLQLGWSVTDPLNNIRRVFSYQGDLYSPRPDHKIHYNSSSLLWAGVMSENLASIDLISRLMEKLNFDQFQKVMTFLGLSPQKGESERNFHYRLSKKTGVSLSHDGIKEQQLSKAVKEVTSDLIFSKEDKRLIKKLKSFWWGKGYKKAIEKLKIRKLDQRTISEREAYTKISLLENNFLHLEETYKAFELDWNQIEKKIKEEGLNEALADLDTLIALNNFKVSKRNGKLILNYFLPENYEEPLELEENEKRLLLKEPEGEILKLSHIKKFWPDEKLTQAKEKQDLKEEKLPKERHKEKVLLYGYFRSKIFKQIRDSIQIKYNQVIRKKRDYLLTRYFEHHDFRIALGIAYISELAKETGIYSKIEPVLSLPLGTSDLTAGEVAKLYQTFLTGKTYTYYKKGPKNQLSFIRRIEDRFGNTLYEPKRVEHDLVSSKVTSQIKEVLRKTMSHGTGRRSKRSLYLTSKNLKSKILIPSFGKTGTTNDFTTSYFAGSIPYPSQFGNPLDPEKNYTIAAYIGYDDNKYMQKGAQRIYGSSGAMPLWIDVAKKTLALKKYNDYVDPFDLSIISRGEWPLTHKETKPFLIDLPRGLILREGKEADKDIYRLSKKKPKNSYYENIFIPDLTLNSILYLPKNPTNGKLSLFKRRD